MTVKKRIMLLIVLAGFITNCLFSIIIFFELIEQPFELLDNELIEDALIAVKLKIADKDGNILDSYKLQDGESNPYWLRVYDTNSGKLFYESDFARVTPVLTEQIKDKAIVKMKSLASYGSLDRLKDHYRFGVFPLSEGDRTFSVQIAKPIGHLYNEIVELIFSIIAGLIFSSLALMVISYFITGKILKPIAEMQVLATDISENNMGQRLPVGKDIDEFANLAMTINNMLDRIQKSFYKQRSLLFDTSHELKTPLTTMRLTIDNYCESSDDTVDAKVKNHFLQLKEQVLRMDQLVKDLLNISAMDALSVVKHQSVNITYVFESLLDDYVLFIAEKNIEVKNDINKQLIINGDEDKLTRAFSNILDNAIKYNIQNGRINIGGYIDNGSAIIKVSNTGAGVDKSQVTRVFDQFYRGEQSRSVKYGGFGLGLTMVKRIIKLHDGTVIFESIVDGLTTVTIKLPV